MTRALPCRAYDGLLSAAVAVLRQTDHDHDDVLSALSDLVANARVPGFLAEFDPIIELAYRPNADQLNDAAALARQLDALEARLCERMAV